MNSCETRERRSGESRGISVSERASQQVQAHRAALHAHQQLQDCSAAGCGWHQQGRVGECGSDQPLQCLAALTP